MRLAPGICRSPSTLTPPMPTTSLPGGQVARSASSNEELVDSSQALLAKVRASRSIEWNKVSGHSGNHGNDYADHLAAQGASGFQTKQWSRWLLPVGSPAPNDPLQTDWCWRCGAVFSGGNYAHQLAGHEGQCDAAGAPPPPFLAGIVVVRLLSGVSRRVNANRRIMLENLGISMKRSVVARRSSRASESVRSVARNSKNRPRTTLSCNTALSVIRPLRLRLKSGNALAVPRALGSPKRTSISRSAGDPPF